MSDFKIPAEFVYESNVWGRQTSAEMLDKVKDLELTSEDVIVATYCKSGTTWVKYILSLMYNGMEAGEGKELSMAVPYLEFLFGGSPDQVLGRITAGPPPRLFGTHTDAAHLRKQVEECKCKIIAVMRNPKDNLVSFYHFYRMSAALGRFTGTFDEWFELVKTKKVWGGDIFNYNLQWWNLRDRDNVMIVFYEDLKADTTKVVQEIAEFCGKTLTADEVKAIAEKTSFGNMKENPKTNASIASKMGVFDFNISPFMRKGEVGDWENYFNEEQNEYIDKRCKEEWEPVGLKCVYKQ